jgi:hypothetical protein
MILIGISGIRLVNYEVEQVPRQFVQYIVTFHILLLNEANLLLLKIFCENGFPKIYISFHIKPTDFDAAKNICRFASDGRNGTPA